MCETCKSTVKKDLEYIDSHDFSQDLKTNEFARAMERMGARMKPYATICVPKGEHDLVPYDFGNGRISKEFYHCSHCGIGPDFPDRIRYLIYKK